MKWEIEFEISASIGCCNNCIGLSCDQLFSHLCNNNQCQHVIDFECAITFNAITGTSLKSDDHIPMVLLTFALCNKVHKTNHQCFASLETREVEIVE